MVTTIWRNAIVGYDPAVALDQLLAHPQNPKIHPTAQTEAIKGIIGEVGWLDGLKVNVQTQHVLDGHDRIKAAMQAGQVTAPVFYVDVPPEQEPYVLSTYDPIGALAGTDSAILADLLAGTRTGDAAVQALLDGLNPAPVDPATLWQGMPEFTHEDQTAEAAFTIRVFLKDANDLAAFGALLGKDLTGKKFVWFGKQPQGTTYEVYE